MGCPRPLVPGALDAEGLQGQVRAAHRTPETLSAEAKAIIEAPENSGRWPLHILASGPGRCGSKGSRRSAIRPRSWSPIKAGSRSQTCETTSFFAVRPRRRNLCAADPRAAPPEEIVALISGDGPRPAGRCSAQSASAKAKDTSWSWPRRASSSRPASATTCACSWVKRTSERGDVLWEVTLEEHDDRRRAGPARPPPRSAARKTRVDLRLRNVLTANPRRPAPSCSARRRDAKIEEVQ